MTDLSHLNAIKLRLANTTARRDQQKTAKVRAWFDHEIKMIEKELAGEYKFLGINPGDEVAISVAEIDAHFGFDAEEMEEMSIDDILTELGA